MKSIGIRELKAQASSLIRQVAESGTTYTITRHGRAAGVLAPSTYVAPASGDQPAQAWATLETLSMRIQKEARSKRSAVRELLRTRR